MRAIVYALCVMELLLDGAKTQTPIDITVEALKEAAAAWPEEVPCEKHDCNCAFTQRDCCCGNYELESLDDHFVETVKDLSLRIIQLKEEIVEVTDISNVAFTAYLGASIKCFGPFLRNTTIPYDVIPLNEGSGYNSVLGLFTAPVPGVYSFSLSVYSRAHSAGDRLYHKVQLMRNAKVEVTTLEDNNWDSEDSSSHTVLLAMKQGDQVYVELVNGRQLCGNIGGLNTFSGYLVYPQPA